MVDSGAPIHVCPSWYGLPTLRSSAKQLSLRSGGGRDVLHHLGSKTGSYANQSFKFELNYEVAPIARPILSVDVVNSKGAQVVFGVGANSLYIQLPDERKIPMIKENGAMV